MESLPHDIVERILEFVPVKSLVRFKSVSKQWKSTMESQYFQTKQLTFGVRSVGELDVLLVSKELKTMVLMPHDHHHIAASALRTLDSLSSLSSPPYYLVCQTSCDGLVCLNAYLHLTIVFNPTTRWHRSLPLSRLQQLTFEKRIRESYRYSLPKLGFGKDKINDTYKPVWLYNSYEFGLENATTCEVFDFSTNSWRYITSSPYRVIACPHPLYLDGMLYWLTEGEETKVVSRSSYRNFSSYL
ncbi:F-box protein [Cardamine amara subsp. amara]|uniref:F-box protein n=1 Tax=Cardamine amara subsp. amara TaxID=228776 RepID=A0ABD1B703_CARAN